MHRLRPTDGEDEDHSDDLGEAEDQELEVSHDQLITALETRIGGRDSKKDLEHNDSNEEAGHRANSKSGIEKARSIWKFDFCNKNANTKDLEHKITADELKKVWKAARNSQNRANGFQKLLVDPKEDDLSLIHI